MKYMYIIKSILDKSIYTVYSDKKDSYEALKKENYNPNDWEILNVYLLCD